MTLTLKLPLVNLDLVMTLTLCNCFTEMLSHLEHIITKRDFDFGSRKLENDFQIHTIIIKEKKQRILQILPSQVYDYTANTCEKHSTKDIPGTRKFS